MTQPPCRTPVVALAVLLLCLAAGCKPARQAETGGARKTYTRDEFRKLVVGKTEAEVLKAIGKPERTTSSGNTGTWVYERLTVDPVTGKKDDSVWVNFEGGVVTCLTF